MPEGYRTDSPDKQMRRVLSTQQLMFISIGSMIGSGWLYAVLSAGAIAGPAVLISWLLAAVLVITMALNYAETATMLPRTGGVVRYPYLTHGRFTGFLLSWSLLIGGITTVSIEALGVVQYSAAYIERWFEVSLVSVSSDGAELTGTGMACAVVLMLFFFVVNVFSVTFLARFNQWITWWKLLIPALTFSLLFFTFQGSNFTHHGGFTPNGAGTILNAVAVSGIIFAFQGFREGINFGGEARNPQRAIFLATVMSVVVVAVIYILLQAAFIGAINWESMGLTPGAWADMGSGNWASQPLYSALEASGIALFGAFGSVLLIDAVISPTGSGWLYMGDIARGTYAMAVQGSLPTFFTRIGARTGIPWTSLVACLVVGCLFVLPFPGWYQLIGFTSATASLTYLAAGPQVQVLRRTAGDLPRPFVLRASRVLSPLGFVAAGLIVYWAGFSILSGVVACFFVAIALYSAIQATAQGRIPARTGVLLGAGFLALWIPLQLAGPPVGNVLPFAWFWCGCTAVVGLWLVLLRRASDRVGKQEIDAAVWLVTLVLVLYLLSYLGAYGPRPHIVLAFPFDSACAAGVCLLAYYWAVRSGYYTPDLRELRQSISEVQEPAPGNPGELDKITTPSATGALHDH